MIPARAFALAAAMVPWIAGLGCGDGGDRVEEPLAAPPPRCAELEEKMLACAREATGLEQLPASVAAGVVQAAGINCRRMRSASRDPELPSRVMAVCGAEPCDTFPACVNREAGPDVVLAARAADGTTRGGSEGPPDFDTLLGSAASAGAPEATSKSAAELCAPFVDKLLACAVEQSGGSFDAAETAAASRAFTESCGFLAELPEATLNAAFARCADAPCGAYGGCVAEALAAVGEPP